MEKGSFVSFCELFLNGYRVNIFLCEVKSVEFTLSFPLHFLQPSDLSFRYHNAPHQSLYPIVYLLFHTGDIIDKMGDSDSGSIGSGSGGGGPAPTGAPGGPPPNIQQMVATKRLQQAQAQVGEVVDIMRVNEGAGAGPAPLRAGPSGGRPARGSLAVPAAGGQAQAQAVVGERKDVGGDRGGGHGGGRHRRGQHHQCWRRGKRGEGRHLSPRGGGGGGQQQGRNGSGTC